MHAFMISYMYTHRIINTKFKIIFKMFVYSNLAFYHISTLKNLVIMYMYLMYICIFTTTEISIDLCELTYIRMNTYLKIYIEC